MIINIYPARVNLHLLFWKPWQKANVVGSQNPRKPKGEFSKEWPAHLAWGKGESAEEQGHSPHSIAQSPNDWCLLRGFAPQCKRHRTRLRGNKTSIPWQGYMETPRAQSALSTYFVWQRANAPLVALTRSLISRRKRMYTSKLLLRGSAACFYKHNVWWHFLKFNAFSKFWGSAVEMSLWSKHNTGTRMEKGKDTDGNRTGASTCVKWFKNLLLWKMFSHHRQGPLLSHNKDKHCQWPQSSRIQPCVLACLGWTLSSISSVKELK